MGISLGMSVYGATETMEVIDDVRVGWTDDSRWIVGVGAEYAAYVEFGTSRMAAQPYLFPSARYVIRTEFDQIESRALSSATPMANIVARTARAIEREAKQRAPVDTGNLRSSIRAFPAEALG
jgi:hypothetical protein